jgi:lipoprotein-releasing system permease protein
VKFELFVAFRYLKAKRKQTMVSVISAISVLGIAAGVVALVIALALSTGFREVIQEKIVGATSHVNVLRIDMAPIRDCPEMMRKLEKAPHVTGIAPAIFNQAFIAGRQQNQGTTVKGVDPLQERGISDFFAHVVEGDPDSLSNRPPPGDPEAPPPPENLIIGKQMARNLGVRVGETVRVIVPMGRLTPFGMTVTERTFRIGAIFESGLHDFDSTWAYTGMSAARRLFSLPADSCSVLQMKIDDLEEAESVADEIREMAGAGYITNTWIELNRPLFSALKLEKLALFITIGLIVLVASLNIVTTLIMMVLEKERDIAILSAMGATSKVIMNVFMLQGLIIGIIGTVTGGLLGIGICRILDAYRLIQLPAEVYSIAYVPFHVRALDVFIVTGTALLISFLATLYPARSASRLNPVEILRYE